MNTIEFFNLFIKHVFLYFSLCYCYTKLMNFSKLNYSKIICIIITTIIVSLLQYYLGQYFSRFSKTIIIYCLYASILGIITHTKISKSILITIISISISYFFSIISFFVIGGLAYIATNIKPDEPIIVILMSFLTFLLSFLLFKIKRFKHGFVFLQKKLNSSLFDIIILTLNIIIIFTYFFIGFLQTYSPLQFASILFFFMLLCTIIIQETFIFYHKQKLQLKALKDYEQELSETKQKLETALSEKRNLVKSNHEFYHRQKALDKKLNDLMILQAHSGDTEISEEIGDIINRINTMSEEYKAKTHTLPNLEKCNIKSIDDMFSYMQYECYKNDIEFLLKINCDVNYIINNYINISQLETLIGDLIRNSIIAINHNTNSYRSIMVVLGIKDDAYELCVYDSGIPFEIDTLIKLGLEPASTHLDEGGTGSGFISTFETIDSCNASFIINEITGTNYTKSLEVKFDGKHEYVIISDRKEEIKKINTINRNITLK